jgi:subtilisin family serine protease
MKTNHPWAFVYRLATLPLLLFLTVLPSIAAADPWSSPLLDQVYLQVDKPLATTNEVLDGATEHDPLPLALLELLSPYRVDYDAFVAAYLPESEADAVVAELSEHNLGVMVGLDRTIQLPWHRMDPRDAASRSPEIEGFAAAPVPELFLVQFAFPLKEDWMRQLDACGISSLGYFQTWTQLVRAKSEEHIASCEGLGGLIAWIDSYRVTDRFDPALLDRESPLGYTLQYPPDRDELEKIMELSDELVVVDRELEGRGFFLKVEGPLEQLHQLLATDHDLLSVTPTPDYKVSDERQGQIIAGNHNGLAPTGPGYVAWLSQRQLLTPTNSQMVLIHADTGYDDGTGPSGAHHPDLENPERLDGIAAFGSSFLTLHDQTGHGTFVAGIIAGNGATGTMATDGAGYHYGTGIAPNVKLVATKVLNRDNLTTAGEALAFARNYPNGTNRATVANCSWNATIAIQTAQGTFCHPQPAYTATTQYFDQRTLDANLNLAGNQPMTFVWSAGNDAFDPFAPPGASPVRMDSVSAPATGKNVIAVGATESYLPGEPPPLSCQPTGCRPPNVDATHIGLVAVFSGRGRAFFEYPSSQRAINTRIKPDLVAPAVRVFSTTPYQASTYFPPVNACTQYYPSNPVTYHSYGTGTSFAAPVVAGTAALLRKWFLDRGTNPRPALLKAALVATADTLGGMATQDHRPSPHYGWGRVNLKRVTEIAPTLTGLPFHINESLALATGQSHSWTVQVVDPTKPTYVVLAWTDPPAPLLGDSQVPLVNDLQLRISGYGSWVGNYFNEVVGGADDGFSHRFIAGFPANDTINNVEAIFIPGGTVPPGQVLSLSVAGMNVTQGSQRYAVYGYNLKQ